MDAVMHIDELECRCLLAVLRHLRAGRVYFSMAEMETITTWTEADADSFANALRSGHRALLAEEQRWLSLTIGACLGSVKYGRVSLDATVEPGLRAFQARLMEHRRAR